MKEGRGKWSKKSFADKFVCEHSTLITEITVHCFNEIMQAIVDNCFQPFLDNEQSGK